MLPMLIRKLMLAVLAMAVAEIMTGATMAQNADIRKPLFIPKGTLVCLSQKSIDLVSKLQGITGKAFLREDCTVTGHDARVYFVNASGPYWHVRMAEPSNDMWVNAVDVMN